MFIFNYVWLPIFANAILSFIIQLYFKKLMDWLMLMLQELLFFDGINWFMQQLLTLIIFSIGNINKICSKAESYSNKFYDMKSENNYRKIKLPPRHSVENNCYLNLMLPHSFIGSYFHNKMNTNLKFFKKMIENQPCFQY